MVSLISIVVVMSLALLVYIWILFPLFISLASRLRAIKSSEAYLEFPSVTVIIAAFNEEGVIVDRIENLLSQDYPKEKVEIIVASDGSTDKTVELAKDYPQVRVLDFSENRGRAMVHNDAAKLAGGEILVFSDAETVFAKDFLKNAIYYFRDYLFGCGAGDFSFAAKGAIGETEGIYWRMERSLRLSEFKLGVLPFASGGCFLIRKELFEPIASHSDIDNILPLLVIEKGRKVFYAQDAKAYDVTVSSSAEHYKKRVRTAQRSMTDILSRFPMLWKRKRYLTLAVLVSHRLLRWLTGYLLGLLLLSNIAMVLTSPGMPSGKLLLGLQGIFYLFVLLGWLEEREVHLLPSFVRKISCAIYSFTLANIAFLVAVWKVASGEKIFSYKS